MIANNSQFIKASPRKILLLLIITSLLTAGSICAIKVYPHDARGWLGVIFFGLGTMLFLFELLLPNRSCLGISSEGFAMVTIFRTYSYKWSDIKGFGVCACGNMILVGFNFSDSCKKEREKLRAFNKKMTGYEALLPDTYRMSPDSLADLLNKKLQAAIKN